MKPDYGHRPMLHTTVSSAPCHLVVTVIPGIMDVDNISCCVVSISQHSMACKLDKHRAPGINFRLEIGEGEA